MNTQPHPHANRFTKAETTFAELNSENRQIRMNARRLLAAKYPKQPLLCENMKSQRLATPTSRHGQRIYHTFNGRQHTNNLVACPDPMQYRLIGFAIPEKPQPRKVEAPYVAKKVEPKKSVGIMLRDIATEETPTEEDKTPLDIPAPKRPNSRANKATFSAYLSEIGVEHEGWTRAQMVDHVYPPKK